MVERQSAFGAFPALTSNHPFAEQDDDRAEGGHVTFESTGPFASATNNSSTVFFNSGEESSWSEGVVEDRQNEEVDYVEELIDESDEEKLDDLGIKGVESYEEDADHLASVCTDDGSTAEGPLLWRMDPKNRCVS